MIFLFRHSDRLVAIEADGPNAALGMAADFLKAGMGQITPVRPNHAGILFDMREGPTDGVDLQLKLKNAEARVATRDRQIAALEAECRRLANQPGRDFKQESAQMASNALWTAEKRYKESMTALQQENAALIASNRQIRRIAQLGAPRHEAEPWHDTYMSGHPTDDFAEAIEREDSRRENYGLWQELQTLN